jgi:lipopolysaccharide export LptBFGC system permease protein LptF
MKKLVLALTLFFASAVPGFAQLGSGIVFDPRNLGQSIKNFQELQEQLQQLRQQYALLLSEAQSIQTLPNRYRYTFSNWQQFAAGNQYGNTGTWANAINSGQAATIQAGYRQLIAPVQPVDITTTQRGQQDWRQQYGLLQLQDAAIMNAIKAAGDTRTNLQQSAQALSQLESDATNPGLQSDKAISQKTLIAMLLIIRNLQDSNRMLEANINLQSQILAQQRWDRGRALNQAALDRQGTGTK